MFQPCLRTGSLTNMVPTLRACILVAIEVSLKARCKHSYSSTQCRSGRITFWRRWYVHYRSALPFHFKPRVSCLCHIESYSPRERSIGTLIVQLPAAYSPGAVAVARTRDLNLGERNLSCEIIKIDALCIVHQLRSIAKAGRGHSGIEP